MINLKKIINQNPKALHDKTSLNEVLLQYYPNEKRSIRILVAFMECGIVKELTKNSNKALNDMERSKFILKMYEDYGFDEKYTKPLLDLWLDTFDIKSQTNSTTTNRKRIDKYSDGLDFHPLDKVYHKNWGEGIVLESKIENHTEIVTIQFNSVGLKKVSASLLNLQNLTNPIDWEERDQRIRDIMRNWTF